VRKPLSVEAAAVTSDSGYTMEIPLPWSNLGVEPREGQIPGLQVYVNDRDGKNARQQARWFPRGDTHRHAAHMHALRLARNAELPVRVSATGRLDHMAWTVIEVTAPPAQEM